ncbi:NUDIX domain containing protein [Nitzschia inconspicua]|uniref:NUDIX domain containing protein n=1 Tax=Nitzschia inconspicua TaxID=303405 RepID=A0A9K3PQT6_9STRA|nr:NUDIX domain containing protein [Nitzschia inconspicua]
MTFPRTADLLEDTSIALLPEKGSQISSEGQKDPTDFASDIFPLDFSLAAVQQKATGCDKNHVGSVPISWISQESNGKSLSVPKISKEDNSINSTNITTSDLSIEYNHVPLSQVEREQLSRRAQEKISKLKESRESRENERFASNLLMEGAITRMVAGCVPILADGRILMISSKTKESPFFSLPKGGWELDECLEEGAMRESFEEAGVLGILGPPLPTFLVESSRGKARVEKLQTAESCVSSTGSFGDYCAGQVESFSTKFCSVTTMVPVRTNPRPPHSHTCMTFFPLYVTKISNDWPESTRQRVAYPIQDAISLIQPGFRWLLEQIQRENLLIRGQQ